MKGLLRSRITLCVSENVRDHVAEAFKIPRDRLPVVYHGVGEEFRPAPKGQAREWMRRRYNIDSPYLLFVGQLKARKNIVRMIHAFAELRREWKPDLKLVLAGRRIWTSGGIDEAIREHRLQNHVVELGHLDLQDLPAVYAGAEVFLFPTLWEGFGIPVVEAMACGTPVVTSNLSCLPEVAGDAAVLVNPYSIEDIAAGVHRFLSDTTLQAAFRTKGLERAKQFTWKRSAEKTLEAYKLAAMA
jgi:glycosyltransferase involved in cell wall biosynthesis